MYLDRDSLFMYMALLRSIGLVFILGYPFPGRAQLELSRIAVDGQEYTHTDGKIRLKGGDEDLLLEFYPLPADSASYLYLMEGLESRWTQSAYPAARYRDLPGGSYTFRIRALEGDRELAETSFPVDKDNAFWNEWWFIPLIVAYVLILIGVGVYLFFLYDFRQKLKIQSVRNRIAADLHDEVGSNLNSIAIFVEVLRKNAPADMLPILEKIIENSRESVALMQDTVWTINPRNDGIGKLFERMNSFAAQILSNKDIAFEFVAPSDPKLINLHMEQRKNVYLIFKEAINNAAKHSNATKVRAEIGLHRDELEILIEDNGNGFDTTAEYEGNGLRNFRERAEEADIDLEVKSVLQAGTRVRMRVAT